MIVMGREVGRGIGVGSEVDKKPGDRAGGGSDTLGCAPQGTRIHRDDCICARRSPGCTEPMSVGTPAVPMAPRELGLSILLHSSVFV